MATGKGNHTDARMLDFLGKRLGCRDIRKSVSEWMTDSTTATTPARPGTRPAGATPKTKKIKAPKTMAGAAN